MVDKNKKLNKSEKNFLYYNIILTFIFGLLLIILSIVYYIQKKHIKYLYVYLITGVFMILISLYLYFNKQSLLVKIN